MTHLKPAAPEWIERIFERLGAQYGNKLAMLYPSEDAGMQQAIHNEWAEALAGFTGDEIQRGLRACQTRPFAPTVGEFALLCRPALDPEFAWLEAADGLRARQRGEMGEWSHPAVYRTAQPLAFEILNQPYRQHRKTWQYRLAREFEQGVGQGIPPVPLAITQQEKPASLPNAAVRARIAQILGRAAPAGEGA